MKRCVRDFIETLPGAASAPRTGAAMQQDEPKKFAMVRTEKVKDLAGLGGRGRHNSRADEKGTEHATSPNPRYTGKVHLIAGEKDAVAAWRKKLAERGIDPKQLRKDSVKAIEMTLHASGDWFDNATEKERIEWVKRGKAFAEKKFGKENILSASLHDDETTPHIHVLAVPLVFKERAKRGRARKGREEAKRNSQPPAWGLSAKEFIGGSKHQHEKLQTEWWEAVADLGLRRGIPKKITGARNMSPAQYRAQQQRKLSEIEAKETEAAADLATAKELRVDAAQDRQEAARVLSAADDTAAALSLGLDAIEAGELAHRPKTSEKPTEGLTLNKTPSPILPREKDALKGWKTAVRPYWDALVGYARRFNHVKERERQVQRDAATISAARFKNELDAIPAVEEIKTRAKKRRGDFER